MVEEECVANARLELLSNTAMLKNVLDRTGGSGGGTRNGSGGGRNDAGSEANAKKQSRGQVKAATIYNAGRSIHHSADKKNCGVGSLQTAIVCPSEGPPVLAERSVYPFTHPLLMHPYHRFGAGPQEGPRHQCEQVPYPSNWIQPSVYLGRGRGDPHVSEPNGNGSSYRAQVYNRTKENLPPLDSTSERPQVPPDQERVVDRGFREDVPVHHPISRAPTIEEHDEVVRPSYEALARENLEMRILLKEKESVACLLRKRICSLEKQISELRQLPTGKISHIPIDDMIRIMQDYGSEVSNQTLPKRKESIKKASIVRQFRRWNPEFFRYFTRNPSGEWVPKLGREGELRRRAEKRRMMKHSQGSSS
mmetsp:Transcript_91904/g.137647  ORF Transcript_91904/g.137647 Transcript_91904/m.137647 type:complete len:364 (-) Transcript_91904:173-1264(-)|eukprot:CAMPEP_0117019128 /NCGR_PEP_ID=MMETSP0472-20121206/14725_1 /TAXON_ID=693140 ORGANISM="Tiarina fusus, Strain LIS" /NCGR_SAMPLE_ID=MMETSP0472 /ASSEMBLY_ACC=CAM_ASM_000603 /LENGTH=363 /DNA_ID=CAMNT_0004724021 /DNA_START=135 /DNA_END=1226 /DNA_ORIENTATION=+